MVAILLCPLFLAFPAGAADLPRPEGAVNDFAGVMDTEDREKIEALAQSVREKTGAQIAAVSVASYEPWGSIDEYAGALFQNWGIGQKNKDNGVLLLLAVDEREVKIEPGYGLEGALPDSRCGRILDTAVLPHFREGRYSAGLLEGVSAIASVIAAENGVDPASLGFSQTDAERWAGEENAFDEEAPWGPFSILEIIFTIIVIVFVILLTVLKIMFPHKFRGRGPGGFSGGGSSGGFSGGGFSGGGSRSSFGGGRSGGGGASRKF